MKMESRQIKPELDKKYVNENKLDVNLKAALLKSEKITKVTDIKVIIC